MYRIIASLIVIVCVSIAALIANESNTSTIQNEATETPVIIQPQTSERKSFNF